MTQANEEVRPIAEKINTFLYKTTVFNKEGWADASKYLPIAFDLVTLKTSTDRKIAGWWNNHEWDGLYLKKEDQVVKWKRIKYEHI